MISIITTFENDYFSRGFKKNFIFHLVFGKSFAKMSENVWKMKMTFPSLLPIGVCNCTPFFMADSKSCIWKHCGLEAQKGLKVCLLFFVEVWWFSVLFILTCFFTILSQFCLETLWSINVLSFMVVLKIGIFPDFESWRYFLQFMVFSVKTN